MNRSQCPCPERLGKVGGQAVLEGVMMKSGERVALTVRKDDGTKETKISNFFAIICASFNYILFPGHRRPAPECRPCKYRYV